MIAEWGHIDVLVNNGRYVGPGHMDFILDTPVRVLRDHLEANALAPVVLIKAIVPHMVEQGSGTVINITSGAGYGDPPAPAGQGGWGLGYAFSKGALHRIAGVLALETQDLGIRAYNVQPGFIATERIAQDMAGFGFDASTGAPRRGHRQSVPLDPGVARCRAVQRPVHPSAGALQRARPPARLVAHGLSAASTTDARYSHGLFHRRGAAPGTRDEQRALERRDDERPERSGLLVGDALGDQRVRDHRLPRAQRRVAHRRGARARGPTPRGPCCRSGTLRRSRSPGGVRRSAVPYARSAAATEPVFSTREAIAASIRADAVLSATLASSSFPPGK